MRVGFGGTLCVLGVLALGACAGAPGGRGAARDPMAPLGPADAVAAADLDGDGFDEPLLVAEGRLRWPGGEAPVEGELQAWAACGAGDGGGEVAWLGFGAGPTARDAPAQVVRLAAAGAEVVWSARGARNEVADLRCGPQGVWLAAYVARKEVAGGWLLGGGWEARPRGGLAARQLPLPDGRLVVGRVYGDAPRSDGDLAVVGPAGRRVLPGLRGVRSLALADLDGDGRPELLAGDGWHYAYGTRAVARLALYAGPDWRVDRTIALLGTSAAIRDIRVLDGRILVVGDREVVVLERDALGWRPEPVGEVEPRGGAAWMRRPGGPAVLLSGRPARIVPLAAG